MIGIQSSRHLRFFSIYKAYGNIIAAMGLIRLLLAFSVVIYHSAPLFGIGMIDGLVAVKLFFIISGFYMALILTEKYKGKYKTFISNRFLRIYPLYWVMLILTIVFNYIWAFTGTAQTFAPVVHPQRFFLYASPLGILRDFTLLIRADYFNPANPKLPLVAPAWSLVIEMLFYLCAPFLVTKNWKIILSLLLGSFIVRAYIYHLHLFPNEYIITNFFPATIGYFLIGVLSYRFYTYINTKKINRNYLLTLLIGTSLFILFWDKIPSIKLFNLLIKEYLFYLAFFIIIPLIFIYTKSSKIDDFLASLSYPIYISHWFFFSFVMYSFSFKSRTQLFVFSLLAFTLLWSVLMVYLVEKPIDRFRHKLSILRSKKV